MFLDQVLLQLFAGKGGDGVVSWRREKYIPKGGPNGGNGGAGGSVIIRTNPQIYSLDYFRFRKILKAENGLQGGANCRQGRSGKDLVIDVPCGTMIKDHSTGELIADLTKEGDEILVCKGGKGGKGNDHFKTPTNRAPNIATKGTFGDQKEVDLELKLIADVGLVGFPNAGKSTLINALARTRAKVASYPFTTLTPNLGFIETDLYDRIFVADIPGIISGASENRGLGHDFLRHIERTRLLVYVIDGAGTDGRDPETDLCVLRAELEKHQEKLLHYPSMILLNKVDEEACREKIAPFQEIAKKFGSPLFIVSALTGEGLPAFKEAVVSFFLSKKNHSA